MLYVHRESVAKVTPLSITPQLPLHLLDDVLTLSQADVIVVSLHAAERLPSCNCRFLDAPVRWLFRNFYGNFMSRVSSLFVPVEAGQSVSFGRITWHCDWQTLLIFGPDCQY
jgi:hypothetical protein